MKIACPYCDQHIECDDSLANRTVECPHCGKELLAPDPGAPIQTSPIPPTTPVDTVVNQGLIDRNAGTVITSQNKDVPVDRGAATVPAGRTVEPQAARAADTLPAGQTVKPQLDRDAMTIGQFMAQHNIKGGAQLDKIEPGSLASVILSGQQGKKYKLGRPIAQGGMGAILDAKDLNIRRNVAMKVMLDPNEATKEQILRFIEEAQITGQLEHPSIVPVYELSVDASGNVFYTMKFVEGRTLKAVLKAIKQGDKETLAQYSLNHLLTVFQKVCDAIAFAHSKRVIHRDLKPENIMVGDYGEVLVMDWGLAKVLPRKGTVTGETEETTGKQESGPIAGSAKAQRKTIESLREREAGDMLKTMAGDVMGTPGYMSPEQATGDIDRIDPGSDIYSLGAILYNILTLEAPVTGADIEEMLAKVARGDIVPPSAYNPTMRKSLRTMSPRGKESAERAPEKDECGKVLPLPHCPNGLIPDSLSAVAMKALSLKSEDRYLTVQSLQTDIEAYQNGFATSAEEASLWKLTRLFIRRHKTISIAAAVLVAVIAVSSWINLWEQAKRRADNRGSAPAYVGLAKDSIERKKFPDAMRLVKTAIEYDSRLADAHMVHALLLLHQGFYQKAMEECREYTARHPEDANVMRLQEICLTGMTKGPSSTPMGEVGTIIGKLGLPIFAAEFVKSAEERLFFYRAKIDKAWPELGQRLTLLKDGSLKMELARCKQVTDLTPLASIPIDLLNLKDCPIADLSPLRGMKLKSLNLSGTKVSDLTVLNGMKLNSLILSVNGRGCPVEDLSPLKGMELTVLDLSGTNVKDLSPLQGMPLTSLVLSEGGRSCPVSDLKPLKGMNLATLNLSATNVKDMSPLAGMRLATLDISGTKVSDLTPLQGMPLTSLVLSDGLGQSCPIADLSPLRGMKLSSLDLTGTEVTDLTPLQEMKLTSLSLSGTKVSNLCPLKDMPLGTLHLRNCGNVSDLKPLAGMPLTRLNINGLRGVSDLDPLKNMKLTWIDMTFCSGITDLTPIKDMPLTSLDLSGCTGITDVSPLAKVKLTSLILHQPGRIKKGMDVLRNAKSLAEINASTVQEFWERYDKGELDR